MPYPEIFGRIAEHFGTPVYVYDEATIQHQLWLLWQFIKYRPLEILYAMKANPNPAILQVLKGEAESLGIDAVSPGEIALAVKLGFLPQRILFTGNNSTDDEVDFAVNERVRLSIDSLSRLEKVGQRYPGSSVCVRINPDVGAGHHNHCITGGPDSKFGIWYTQVREIKDIARQHDLKIIGLHQHIGSGILDVGVFLKAMNALLPTALSFPDLKFVDFGGGLGVPYDPKKQKALDIESLGARVSARFADFCQDYGRTLILVIEPGRFLVAEAGYLVVRVTTVKRIPKGRVFVGVDSGFNHLVRPMMYDAHHEIENISNPEGKKVKVDIVGNICESGDRFAAKREIREPREGDLLVIKTVGAYGFSMASTYNLRPKPPEILVRADPNEEIRVIRRRETIHDLLKDA